MRSSRKAASEGSKETRHSGNADKTTIRQSDRDYAKYEGNANVNGGDETGKSSGKKSEKLPQISIESRVEAKAKPEREKHERGPGIQGKKEFQRRNMTEEEELEKRIKAKPGSEEEKSKDTVIKSHEEKIRELRQLNAALESELENSKANNIDQTSELNSFKSVMSELTEKLSNTESQLTTERDRTKQLSESLKTKEDELDNLEDRSWELNYDIRDCEYTVSRLIDGLRNCNCGRRGINGDDGDGTTKPSELENLLTNEVAKLRDQIKNKARRETGKARRVNMKEKHRGLGRAGFWLDPNGEGF